MKTRNEILTDIHEGLSNGVISEADLKSFMMPQPEVSANQPQSKEAKTRESSPHKISAVDAMFYIAGVILFSAIMSIIVQSWNDGSAVVHIMLSAGVGVGLWLVAFYLTRSSRQNDIRKGLINALLLTGSLSVIVGGFIIMNELVGDFEQTDYAAGAATLAILGGIHIALDRYIRRDLILLMGTLLLVTAFPTLLFGFLQEVDISVDIWSVIIIISAALLASATRVIAKINPDRQVIHSAFDSFAVFITLLAMYISSFGDYGVMWLVALVASILGIFYLSIIYQNKHLLGSGSFFLVVTVITIAFKYFSGYGVTTSLIISAMGLLGSAATASTINKKYFKAPEPDDEDKSQHQQPSQ